MRVAQARFLHMEVGNV